MRNIVAGGNYERLTPHERLIMLTEAKARGDEAEEERLYASAPVQSWRVVDRNFMRGHDVLKNLTLVAGMSLNQFIGELQIIDKMLRMIAPILQLAAAETVPKVLDALSEDTEEHMARHLSGMIGKSATTFDIAPDKSDSEAGDGEPLTKEEWGRVLDALTAEARQTVGDIVENWRDSVLKGAAALLASFDRLTRKVLNIDGLTVLRAWVPPLAEELVRLKINERAPKAEMVNLWAPVWAQAWNRRMGIETSDETNGVQRTGD